MRTISQGWLSDTDLFCNEHNDHQLAMVISDSVDIEASPAFVFNWFMNLDRHYREWHPDHRDSYLIKGEGLTPGSILYAEEILHGELHKLRYQITDVEINRRIGFRILGIIGLLIPKGEFLIEPTKNGLRFTATLYPRVGRFLKFLMPARFNALATHQREEGHNLKRILETPR